MTLIQGTRRPFRITLVSDGDPDLTAVTGLDLYVRRDYEGEAPSVETWEMSIEGGATSTLLSATYAPTASGEGAVVAADETIRARPIMHFGADAEDDIEADPFLITVEER